VVEWAGLGVDGDLALVVVMVAEVGEMIQVMVVARVVEVVTGMFFYF